MKIAFHYSLFTVDEKFLSRYFRYIYYAARRIKQFYAALETADPTHLYFLVMHVDETSMKYLLEVVRQEKIRMDGRVRFKTHPHRNDLGGMLWKFRAFTCTDYDLNMSCELDGNNGNDDGCMVLNDKYISGFAACPDSAACFRMFDVLSAERHFGSYPNMCHPSLLGESRRRAIDEIIDTPDFVGWGYDETHALPGIFKILEQNHVSISFNNSMPEHAVNDILNVFKNASRLTCGGPGILNVGDGNSRIDLDFRKAGIYVLDGKEFRIDDTVRIWKTSCMEGLGVSDIFKKSFVISVDDRRLERFQTVFRHHGLPVPKLWKGFRFGKDDFGKACSAVHNCAFSHASIIKTAQYLDFPYVCIFEDDAYPCIGISEKLETYLKNVPVDCECLILGQTGRMKSKPFDYRLCVPTNHSYGAHAYIVFKSGYDKILKSYEDEAIADNVFKSVKAYAVIENLFIQYNFTNNIHNHPEYYYVGKTQDEIFRSFPKMEDILNDT